MPSRQGKIAGFGKKRLATRTVFAYKKRVQRTRRDVRVGRRSTIGNRVTVEAVLEFESLSLRHKAPMQSLPGPAPGRDCLFLGPGTRGSCARAGRRALLCLCTLAIWFVAKYCYLVCSKLLFGFEHSMETIEARISPIYLRGKTSIS